MYESAFLQIRQSTQNRKSQLENVNIDWNLSQDEGGSIDLSDEDMTVVDNSAVNKLVPISGVVFLKLVPLPLLSAIASGELSSCTIVFR